MLKSYFDIWDFVAAECDREFTETAKKKHPNCRGVGYVSRKISNDPGLIYQYRRRSRKEKCPPLERLIKILDILGYRFFIAPKDEDPEKTVCLIVNEDEK